MTAIVTCEICGEVIPPTIISDLPEPEDPVDLPTEGGDRTVHFRCLGKLLEKGKRERAYSLPPLIDSADGNAGNSPMFV
jgi:hypothetical protein